MAHVKENVLFSKTLCQKLLAQKHRNPCDFTSPIFLRSHSFRRHSKDDATKFDQIPD